MYKTYVEILESGSVCISPSLKKSVRLIERVQHYFTRYVIEDKHCYRTLLLWLGKSQVRLYWLDLIFAYILICGCTDLKSNDFFILMQSHKYQIASSSASVLSKNQSLGFFFFYSCHVIEWSAQCRCFCAFCLSASSKFWTVSLYSALLNHCIL